MAIVPDWFVYDGGDNADGLSWATAYQSIVTLIAEPPLAGDIVAIASDHSEANIVAHVNASGIGTLADPIIFISLDRTDDTYENMVAGGGRMVQNDAGGLDWTLGQWSIWVGIDIHVGDNIFVGGVGDALVIDSKLEVNDNISLEGAAHGQSMTFEDVDVLQATGGGILASRGLFTWRGGSFAFNGGSITNLISTIDHGGNVIIEDVDLSAIGADDYLVLAGDETSDILFNRCKIGAIAGFVNGTIGSENFKARFHSVSAGDIIHQLHEAYTYGTIDDETGIYLDAEYDGSNGYSAKMISNASALPFFKYLKFDLGSQYITAINKTITIELMTDNVTLHDDDFWIYAEYPDGTIAAQGNILSTKQAAYTGGSTVELTASAKGAGDWTGEEGLGAPKYYKCVLDFTGVADEAIGEYDIWACLAIPSTTVYVDLRFTVA